MKYKTLDFDDILKMGGKKGSKLLEMIKEESQCDKTTQLGTTLQHSLAIRIGLLLKQEREI